MSIHYLSGDATAPAAVGEKFIVHVCNDIGGWGKGFVLALSRRWPEPEKAYRQWYKSQEGFALGEIQLVSVAEQLQVCNLIGQRDIRTRQGVPPIRYEAITAGLAKLAPLAKQQNASIHMPRIGCGLAGGSWEVVEDIIEKTLLAQELDVFVYDF